MNIRFKHLSLDVWNTLIKPNPLYAAARTEMIATKLNLDAEVVNTGYRKVKRELEYPVLLDSGACPTSLDAWISLVHELMPDISDDDAYVRAMYFNGQSKALFFKHRPTVNIDSVEMFNLLQMGAGISYSISCNSNFIDGYTVEMFLRLAGFSPVFSVYSDVIGASKPSKKFFDRVKECAYAEADEILHIGDTQETDIVGATRAGMHSLLITDIYNVPSAFAALVGTTPEILLSGRHELPGHKCESC